MVVCSSSSTSPSKPTLSTQNDKNKTRTESPSQRKKSPGVRLVGGRIYDSENGKSCHQCRQKTMDFVASCKNQSENKQCTLHFCHKCLLNRYGEKAEEVAALYDWKCPKCRGICNCSFCMKKQGHRPTGVLGHTAKATGFSLVSKMLHHKGSENSDSKKMAAAVAPVIEIPLPQGTELNNVAAIDMPAEDVGHALQFLEFCEAFGQVLNLKKGQPQFLLRELACGRSRRHRKDSSIVRFHIQLLSMIEKDSGKEYPSLGQYRGGNSWSQAFSKCISESQYPLKELLLDSFDVVGDGYDKLDFSKKLRLLNFLCDEALGTADLRGRIDEQNSKFVRREKKVKVEVLAAEKNMKKKLQDEVARAILAKNAAPLSISEHVDLVSKIKTEAAQTLTETLEATDMVPKKKHRSDAVRSEPILLDGNGHKFWRLRGYSGEMDILLQDIGGGDMFASQDRWFTYDVEQRDMVEKYISSSRKV